MDVNKKFIIRGVPDPSSPAFGIILAAKRGLINGSDTIESLLQVLPQEVYFSNGTENSPVPNAYGSGDIIAHLGPTGLVNTYDICPKPLMMHPPVFPFRSKFLVGSEELYLAPPQEIGHRFSMLLGYL